VPGAQPDQLPQRRHRVVALQQDLQRVEQADVEQPDDLLDQVVRGRHAAMLALLDVECQVASLGW
jgi:hypothetical protein